MAAAIEHRDKGTVLQAFEYFELPNFAIYALKDQRTSYAGDDIEVAEQKLSDYLDMIEASNTSQIYTLKMYPAGIKIINTKTPSVASTTFMLNANQPVKQENGVTIIDRTIGSTGGGTGNPALMARMDKLEADNARLRDDLHKAELKNIEDRFTHAIAGIKNEPPDIPWYERLIGAIEEKPELIDKMLNPIEKLLTGVASVFIKPRDFIQQPAAETTYSQPVNGTNTDQMSATATQPLTEAEIEAIHDQQNVFIEKIAERIGEVNLLALVKKVAESSDADLNKMLTFLL